MPSASPWRRLRRALSRIVLAGELLKPLVDHAEAALGNDVLSVSGYQARRLALEPRLEVVVDRLRPLRARLEVGRRVDVEAHDLRIAAFAANRRSRNSRKSPW